MQPVTRLRYVSSKKEDTILEWVNTVLTYKIEIKSITHTKNKWYVWFVLPEDSSLIEITSGDLD
jgi:hypothetical protein